MVFRGPIDNSGHVMSTTAAGLGTLPLFGTCAPDELERLARAVTGTRLVAQGDAVCREGERASCWWIVGEGLADLTSRGLYLATVGPGETIGELALLDGEPRSATVTAVTDMVLHEVSGDGFFDALRESPGLSMALLRELAIRLRR